MNPHIFNHYQRVANAMSRYVAASTYNYYDDYDGFAVPPYPGSYYSNGFYGGYLSDALYYLGFPNSIVSVGSWVDQWVDYNL